MEGDRTGRHVIVLRAAERVDFSFPEWMKLAFDEINFYTPYDLNMPLKLHPRDHVSHFLDDPPITELGHVNAQMVGRGLERAAVYNHLTPIRAVYSSPALRCLQTSDAMIKGWGEEARSLKPVEVEPGLFEYMGWYNVTPHWLGPKEQALLPSIDTNGRD